MKPLLLVIASSALLATVPTLVAETSPGWIALAAYAAPVKGDIRAGNFRAATEEDATEQAVEGCKLHNRQDAWSNCVPGRWIQTGRYFLVAAVCDAFDSRDQPHKILRFLKDGVTGSDQEIRDAVQLEMIGGTIAENGCHKLRIDNTPPDDLETARSVAIDKAH